MVILRSGKNARVAIATSGGSLTLVEDPSVWATRQDVVDIVAGRRAASLVCALGADQFTGEATTRYSRRGHIPTSVNLSARDLARGAGRLLPAPELADVVGQALPEEDRKSTRLNSSHVF